MTVELELSRGLKQRLWAHLLKNSTEQVAFLFADVVSGREVTVFRHKDKYFAQPADFDIHSAHHVSLNDNARAWIIKRAWDSGTSLVEFHSHPFERGLTSFSPSDLFGLREFVPHCWWRLRGRPYGAVVVGRRNFDALCWITDSTTPRALDAITVDSTTKIMPTGETISCLETQGAEYGFRSV